MVLPALFSMAPSSLQDHMLWLLRPPGPMALRSKPWFLTLVFEAPVPCKIYARLPLDSFYSRPMVLSHHGLPARPASHGYACLYPSTFAQVFTPN